MKRLSAILLLAIFSFNLFGYRLIASFLENSANTEIEAALDQNHYSDEQLISIKQPTNLPYYQNSAEFQRIDGEVEIDGVYYKYVKCRVYNDSLELMCIPNTAKTKIQAAKADFSRLAGDIQQSGSKKKSSNETKSFNKSISDFEELQLAFSFDAGHSATPQLPVNKSFVNDLFTKAIEQPPDQFSARS